MTITLPTLDAFSTAATDADLIALCVPVAFDHETAVTLADRFVDEPSLFLLESAAAGPAARHSFVGFDPLWTWQVGDAKAGVATLRRGDASTTVQMPKDGPVAGLRQLMHGQVLRSCYPEGVRLGGPDVAAMAGSCGYFGYDVAQALEPSIGAAPPKTLGLPDAVFFLPQSFLILDHLARRLFICRIAECRGKDLRALYQSTCAQLTQLAQRLHEPHSPKALNLTANPPDYAAAKSAVTQGEFTTRVQRCLEEIRAGEIFQIQIGNRLSCATAARPFDVFRHLRMLNPSPYMFYYRAGDHHILGASPEMMVGVQGGQMTHRPIAGTRRRTWDPVKDQAMRRELVESEKERAEHVMLVDLARNDIGCMAAPGTVKVEELMTVEEYSHVFHMVSQVTGKLAPGRDAFDAMDASFPNGTVSGAPKIRAMQLIYQVETISREFYAGSLGLFDFNGDLKSTLLIRTIHMAHGVASTQASGGVVYDSTPEGEWLETRNKMAACLLAMQNTH